MPETLYLTCNIIDRYLAIRNVTRKRLQLVCVCGQRAGRCTPFPTPATAQHAHSVVLTRARLQVGVTAMLIASKYEEIWAPEVNDFVYISDKAYTRCVLTAAHMSMRSPFLTCIICCSNCPAVTTSWAWRRRCWRPSRTTSPSPPASCSTRASARPLVFRTTSRYGAQHNNSPAHQACAAHFSRHPPHTQSH